MDEELIDALIDLLRLYRKYGDRTMIKVRDLLKSKGLFPEIIDILIDLPEFNRSFTNYRYRNQESHSMKMELNRSLSSPETSKGIGNKSIPKELERMKETAPMKHVVLSEVYSRLLSGDLLPTMSDIRNFAIENHITEAIGKERRSAISPLMRFLIKSKNSKEDLDKLLREMVKFTSSSDSSTLQRWADIIMRDKWKESDDDPKGK